MISIDYRLDSQIFLSIVLAIDIDCQNLDRLDWQPCSLVWRGLFYWLPENRLKFDWFVIIPDLSNNSIVH